MDLRKMYEAGKNGLARAELIFDPKSPVLPVKLTGAIEEEKNVSNLL